MPLTESKNRHTVTWTIYLSVLIAIFLLISYLNHSESHLSTKIIQWSAGIAANTSLVTPEHPPAYLPINEVVTKLQTSIETHPVRYGRLTISVTEKPANDSNMQLLISMDEFTHVQPMPFESLELSLISKDSRDIKLQVIETKKRFLFGKSRSNVTKEKRIPLHLLNKSRPLAFSLPVLVGKGPELAVHSKRTDFVFTLQLMDFEPDENSGQDGRLTTARSFFAGSTEDRVIHHIDSVSFNDGDATDHLHIRPEHPWLAVIVVADRDLTRHLSCIRSDDGRPIGAYDKGSQTFAGITDASAELVLSFKAKHINETIDYEVFALSAETDPAKKLLFWYLEHYLTPKIRENRPIKIDSLKTRLHWLYLSMGVSLNREDQKSLSEPVLRDLVDSLQVQPDLLGSKID